METHIPYFALRSYSPHPAAIDERGLRRRGKLHRSICLSGKPEYLYEAQISILVTGVDEWFWTAYCLTDTFFGCNKTVRQYYDDRADAPSGGDKPAHYPIWNPREYFIRVVFRRMRQATKEWGNIVSNLDARIGKLVSFPQIAA